MSVEHESFVFGVRVVDICERVEFALRRSETHSGEKDYATLHGETENESIATANSW